MDSHPTKDSEVLVLDNLNMLVVDLQLASDQIPIKDLEVIVIMMIPVKLVNGESRKLTNPQSLQNLKYLKIQKFICNSLSKGYTVKSGTKYESPIADKKEEKPAEKKAAPLIPGPGGSKVLPPPRGSKIVQQTQPQQDLLGGDDLLTGGDTAPVTTNNTASNADPFGWDQPQQPTTNTNNNANQNQCNRIS